MIISDLEYQQEVAIDAADVKGGIVSLVIGQGKFYVKTGPLVIPAGKGFFGIINTPSVNIPFPEWTAGWGVP
jgi:hypothetical protein